MGNKETLALCRRHVLPREPRHVSVIDHFAMEIVRITVYADGSARQAMAINPNGYLFLCNVVRGWTKSYSYVGATTLGPPFR